MDSEDRTHRADFHTEWRRIASSIVIIVGLLGMAEFLPSLCAIARAQETAPSGLYWTSANYGVNSPAPGLPGTSPYYSGLFRQTNCSLTDVVLDSTYASVMKTPNYQDILHSESGSTTIGDKFAKGCPGPSTGITSGDIASLGKLPNGDTAYAVISTDSDGFTVYFFDSAYTATAQQNYTTISASNPESAMFGFASADLNGDGVADVVVASEIDPSTGTLSVFLGNGDGTFTQKQTINVPLVQGGNSAGPVIGVTIDDINGDGKLDLIAVTNPPAANSGITVFLGKGDGSFPTTGIAGPAGAGGQTAVTADFNEDGKKDIATSYGQILLGHGDGTFSLVSQSIPEGNGTAGIAVADFNQDGKMDLAFPHQSGTVINVYFGKGDGTFTYSAAYPSIVGDPSLQSSDLDGDGFPDLFVGYAQGGILSIQLNSNYFFQSILNRGDGTFGKSRAYFTGNSPANSFASVYDVADFTGDGKPDIVFVGSTNGTATGAPNLTVLKNAGDGTFQLSGTQSPITGPDFVLSVPAIAAGDLTGSGKNDVVFTWGSSNEGTTPHLSVVMGNGDGTFQPQQDYAIPAEAANPLLLVDVNGDKKPDAVFIASADGTPDSTGLYVMLNNGDGSFGQAKLVDSEPTMSDLAAQDVNGDGKTDIVVVTAGNLSSQPAVPGAGYLYLGKGDGTFQHATSVNSGGLYSQVTAIADMNGDGKPDLVFAGTTAAGSAGSVTVLLGNGNGTFQAGISTPASGGATGIVIADGNADGKPDVILAGATSPYYLESNGDGTFNAANSGNFFVGVDSKNLKTADLTGQKLPSLLMTSGATIQAFVAGPVPTTTKTATSTALTISPNRATVGQTVTMTAQLSYSGSSAPTGTVAFMNGSTQLGTGTLNGNGQATYSTSSLAAGTYSVTAVYSGDTNFSGSTSNAVSLTVSAAAAADFSIAASPGSQTISPGQNTTYTLTVTPTNGFNQATTFACSGLPSEASCSFSPMSVTPNGTVASTTTMTITTTAPATSSRSIPAWPFGSGGIVAACGLFFLAKRKRMPSIFCVMLLIVIGGVALGCGSNSQPKTTTNPGTPTGRSTVTVTATGGGISHSTKMSLVVST